MPLYFTEVCDLLNALEKISKSDPPHLPLRSYQKYSGVIQSWFASFKISLHSNKVDPVVLLSALYPAKRTDRIFNIQAKSLTRKLRRCLKLGSSRWPELQKWTSPGHGDLSECVERVLKQAEFLELPACKQVTLQQIDDALASIASRCRFSGAKTRQSSSENEASVLDILGRVYGKLQSREAKWLTRIILKDLSCIDLDGHRGIIYSCIDPRLPTAMQMYDDFESAIAALRALSASQPSGLGQSGRTQPCLDDACHLTPRIGTKIGPPSWAKAKGGIRHALNIVNGRTMSLERKYDGEYCQIHVDLSKGDDCIQIFSKSGKDSTEDRKGIVPSIKDGLRLRRSDCSLRQKGILEGELLVWDDRRQNICDFHVIRKHVSRSGVFLGTDQDSLPHDHEHLMMVFYDILLIDEDISIHRPYSQRRRLLEQALTPIQGRVCLSQREEVRFSQSEASDSLKKSLAKAFALRWEGIVLKPSDEPYFSLRGAKQGYSSRWIKLKKDCIRGLGDTADFAVVGAGYDAKRAIQLGLSNLRWTHFFLGCLTNKHEALHLQAKPEYLIIDCVTDCIQLPDFEALNNHGQFLAIDAQVNDVTDIAELKFAAMDPRFPRMQTIFRQPFVFDVAGSGFDKGPNRSVFTLRFPRVLKIRWDRNWTNCVDIHELQNMAEEARKLPGDELEREIAKWMERLDDVDRRANGRPKTWETSDEERVNQHIERPPAETAKTGCTGRSRRSATRNAPPLVRMDTPETQADERRMSNGEVTSQAISIGSNPSDAPLRTISHRKSSNGGCQTLRTFHNDVSTQRKRDPEPEQDAKSTEGTKRRKTSHTSVMPVSSSGEKELRPLQEITNDARPTLNSRISTPPAHNPRHSPAEFELARKIPVDAHEYLYGRRRKPVEFIDLSSPARETTADEKSSGCTTQQTAMQYLASPSIAGSSKMKVDADSLPAPTGTEEAVLLLKKSPFQDCIILHSSSVEPQLTARCSASVRSNTRLLSLDGSLEALDHRLQESPSANQNNIVLVTDTESIDTACNDLIAAVRQLNFRQHRSLTVFDVKALSLPAKGAAASDQDLQKTLQGFFCAKLMWQGNGDPEEDAIKVQWRSGEVDIVSTKHVEALRRMVRSSDVT